MPVYGLAEAALAVSFSSPLEELQTQFFDRTAMSDGDIVVSTARDASAIELADVGRHRLVLTLRSAMMVSTLVPIESETFGSRDRRL